ncbi:MAG: hypothetical protein V7682_07845 [Cycloclasticus sp.]
MQHSKNKFSRVSGIASTYIHLKDMPRGLSLEEAHEYLERIARKWAKLQYNREFDVNVLVEEGSLIGRIVLSGVTIYGLVAGYGSFRSGIDHIVEDGHAFSSHVIDQFENDYHITDDAIIRAERRLGVPGKIQRFFVRLDGLNSDDLSRNEREVEIEKLQQEFIKIIELLPDDRDRAIFQEAANSEPHETNELIDRQPPNVPFEWPFDPFPIPEGGNVPRIAGPRNEDT